MADDKRKFHMHDGQTGAALAIRVTPRSSKNEIAEVTNDGTIKVRLTAAPVDGQANKALVSFLSEVLDIPQSKIDIIAGLSGRDKLVAIRDLNADEAQARIIKNIA